VAVDWNDFNKQHGHALELEHLTRAQLELLQAVGYVKVLLWNRRLGDLARFAWRFRREGWAVAAKLLLGRRPRPVAGGAAPRRHAGRWSRRPRRTPGPAHEALEPRGAAVAAAPRPLLWPLRQALKWPAHRLGDLLGRPLAGPILASWFTTYACDLRCRFCDLPAAAARAAASPLARAEKLAVLEDLAAIGTAAVGFTGGEPACDPDLETLVRAAATHGLVTHLSTNGLAFASDAAAEALPAAGLHAVSFSIDGVTAATHDGLRGRGGSLDEVMGALRRALAARRACPGWPSPPPRWWGRRTSTRCRAWSRSLSRSASTRWASCRCTTSTAPGRRCARPPGRGLRRLDGVSTSCWRAAARAPSRTRPPTWQRCGARSAAPVPRPLLCWLVSVVIDPWGDLYRASRSRSWASPPATCARPRCARSGRGGGAPHARRGGGCRRCYWNCHAELSLLMAGPRGVAPEVVA